MKNLLYHFTVPLSAKFKNTINDGGAEPRHRYGISSSHQSAQTAA